jgi:hypothetical protein
MELIEKEWEDEARKILKRGHMPNRKVYLEVRAFLNRYAVEVGQPTHTFVPYWVYQLSPRVLAVMMKTWCNAIKAGNYPPGSSATA